MARNTYFKDGDPQNDIHLVNSKWLTQGEISAAKAANPLPYLESLGYTVQGNDARGHLSVNKVLRTDRRPEGHWVACQWDSSPIGDNIALVRYLEPHKSFTEAVQTLAGGASLAQVAWNPAPARAQQHPTLPRAGTKDISRGRTWLQSRGIGLATLEAAEQAGMLRYGPNGVFFIGLDQEGQVRSATKRMLSPEAEPGNPDKQITKRDLTHSDKQYPAILPGDDRSHTLHLVEGGTDALALHEIARQRMKPLPTVIVTGGSRVLRWLENPQVQSLIQTAARVVVHKEREKNPEVQAKTDADHEKQAANVRALRTGLPPDSVRTWIPPQGKDLADYNQVLQKRERSPEPAQQVIQPAARGFQRDYPAMSR